VHGDEEPLDVKHGAIAEAYIPRHNSLYSSQRRTSALKSSTSAPMLSRPRMISRLRLLPTAVRRRSERIEHTRHVYLR